MVYWLFLVPYAAQVDVKDLDTPSWVPFRNNVRIANLYGAQKKTGGYGVDIQWANSNTLKIDCAAAEVDELKKNISFHGRNFQIVYCSN